MIVPVILAGGTGSRLWPLSRTMYPKQFYSLIDDNLTMLQQTCMRIKDVANCPPIVVSNESHRFIVSEQLRQIECNDADIILEPQARDSAAGISVAAHHVVKKYGAKAVMMVLAADHYIDDLDKFHSAMNRAIQAASKDILVVFGVKPVYPETGYGYIKSVGGANPETEIVKVESFTEKPNKETARKYIADGGYYWNSGMFVFNALTLLNELGKYEPDIVTSTEMAMNNATIDLDFIRLQQESFKKSPKISIDYALMERSDKVHMVSMLAKWNDVGSWKNLWNTLPKDTANNLVKGDALLLDTKNSLVLSQEKKTVVSDLDGIVVVDTKDALLVTRIESSQKVKQIVGILKAEKQTQELTKFHREVYRPWGHYDSIDAGQRYQVKRITVKPGEKLSLQMHHHRAEHWVVVSGTAKVYIDDNEKLLTENQSVYIPVGSVHSLENPGKIPLDIIEVQSGSYLGEDDILRFEDKYGRD